MIQLIALIIVVGVLLYLAQRFLAPIMDPLMMKLLYGVVVVAMVLYILWAFGVLPINAPVPKLK